VTRRTTSQIEREKTKHTALRIEPGENLEKIPAENSARQKCNFTSQAGKRHPLRDQEAAGSVDATQSRSVQQHGAKPGEHKGR
jgi:hypothetical protein